MSLKRRWVWALRIGLALASLAVALLALELYLRRDTPREEEKFLGPAPDGVDVPYALRPDTDVVFEGKTVKIAPTHVRISAQGLREDKVYTVPKPAGQKRLLCFGDSFVFGWGVELEDTFVKRFEARLGGKLEAINFGVPGYNTTHAVELLEKRGLILQPDGVLVFLSDNDLYEKGADRLDERREQGEDWAVERYVKSRTKRKQKAESAYERDPTTVRRKLLAALDRLRAVCERAGIPYRVVLLFPNPMEGFIRDVIAGKEPLMFDDYLKDIRKYQIPGDMHPNALGHDHIAGRLYEVLGEWARQL